MPTSLPVGALSVLGILITVLGLFAAGSVTVAAVGLLALFGAGVLEIVGTRSSPERPLGHASPRSLFGDRRAVRVPLGVSSPPAGRGGHAPVRSGGGSESHDQHRLPGSTRFADLTPYS